MAEWNNNNAEMPPNSGIVSKEFEAGFERIFGARKCKTKTCGADLAGDPADALWCKRCKEASD